MLIPFVFQRGLAYSSRMTARNGFSLYKNIKVFTKAHECSVLLLKIPSWVLVSIFTQKNLIVWSGNSVSALCVNVKNMSINICINETGSSTKITVVVDIGLFRK